jgi:YesN/AraC family two-component response regulator
VLAAELGYDAKYLSSLFKKKKGTPFTQYLRELRIAHALFLMEQGVVSVKNIAILAGFGDALYFSKIFKEVMGVSPKSYIEGLHKGE